MAAHDYIYASEAQEAHHAMPRCLLRLRDRADAHEEFDGEGIQLWLDYELEALRYGVDPDLSREELTALIKGSTVLPREEHRNGHESDFVRWGRRGARDLLAPRAGMVRVAGAAAVKADQRLTTSCADTVPSTPVECEKYNGGPKVAA